MTTPTAVELAVLSLAAFRAYWLLAEDTITEPLRRRLTGYADDGTQLEPVARLRLRLFIACPWCAGFWIAVLETIAWIAAPRATMIAALALTVSAAVALLAILTRRLIDVGEE